MTEVAGDLARASALLDVKQYDEAASLLNLIVAVEPQDSRAWCLLAAAHLGNGQYQEAAEAASRAVTLAPSDDWPYRLASTAQARLGHITAARAAATEACKLAPGHWRAHLCLAQAELAGYVKFNAWEQGASPAQRAIASALRLAPDEPDVHVVAGRLSFALGRRRTARAHLERALALDPAHSGALNELGRHAADRARAVRYFIHAARSAPQISVYGQNVDATVRRLVYWTICGAATAGVVLSFLATYTRLGRGPLLIGYAAIAVLSAGFLAVQLQRMPPAARPLFRTRRIALALATAYGAILIAMIVAAVTPTAVPAVTLLIVASMFIAAAILRRKQERIKILRPLANGPGVVIATRGQAPPADHETLEDVSAQPVGQRARPGHLPRSVWAIFGLVIIAPVVVIAVLALTPSPPALTVSQLMEDQLDPGDCLTGSNLGLGTGRPWPGLVTAVPCTRRHLAEIFFAGNLWPESLAAYPGDNTIADQGYARCASAFRAYDGIAQFESVFTIDYIPPDKVTWASGDRLLVCMAYEQPQPGVPMNDSIKGSHR